MAVNRKCSHSLTLAQRTRLVNHFGVAVVCRILRGLMTRKCECAAWKRRDGVVAVFGEVVPDALV